MPYCPICREESEEVVHTEEVEVRGKRYLHQICYCPSDAVKFTFFTSIEEQPVAEES
ncbi:MAG: hypothetical protein V3U52_07765 [Thermoplasmata archaeon]